MKALSVKQPWASLLVCGEKKVECRTWRPKYRGELLICSSKGDFTIDGFCTTPGGMAVGVVELVDVRPMTRKDLETAFLPDGWEEDALKGFAWHMRAIGKIEPFPVKGKLSFFEVDKPIKLLPPDHQDYMIGLIRACHTEIEEED